MTPQDTLSLFEFTSQIGIAIHAHPSLRNVWITAELSDVAVRGGHFYADLIQKNETGQTVARMRANLWASLFPRLRAKYYNETGEDLRNGIKVRIQGNATHHSIYGLSFNITEIDPSYVDEGDILRRRMEILQKMRQEGVYDDNHTKDLPADTQRIAVISAEGAAGLGDFINQLEHNPERFRFKIKLFQSPMQGEKAPAGVIEALGRINKELEEWDCVVIIRGGGATADMNCFDNEVLARNVCNFPIPVIVGIGHERDNCVLDYIAHTRCKTPTAVAEFLIEHQRQAWLNVSNRVNDIIKYLNLYLDGEKQRITQLSTAFPAMLNKILEQERLRIKNFYNSLPLTVGGITSRENTRLQGIQNLLVPALNSVLSQNREKVVNMEKLLHVLSPDNVLKRGYSITRINGKALKAANEISEGDIIETRLAEGSVFSEIKNIKTLND